MGSEESLPSPKERKAQNSFFMNREKLNDDGRWLIIQTHPTRPLITKASEQKEQSGSVNQSFPRDEESQGNATIDSIQKYLEGI